MPAKKVVGLLFLVAAIIVGWLETQESTKPQRRTSPKADSSVVQAFDDRRSNVWLDAQGTVHRLLKDDNDGSRHQRFLLRLSTGHTVLVAHNIDLAPRVPLVKGTSVNLHGEYEWNEKGGVIHWTHHDPQDRLDGGYIDYDGKRYE